MKRFGGLALALVAVAAAVAPPLARAQVVASTFGPGDSYSSIYNLWWVNSSQSIAQNFTYNGADGYSLAQLRVALWGSTTPYAISFRTGTDMNSATTLESWILNAGGNGIYTLSSATLPSLTPDDVFWIVLQNAGPIGAVYQNIEGFRGFSSSAPPDPNWYPNSDAWSIAYDVTVAPVTVTPEPASIALLGTGLIGLGLVGLLRRAA